MPRPAERAAEMIRLGAYAVLGAAFLLFAGLGAAGLLDRVPAWASLAFGLGTAALVFVAAFALPRAAVEAAHDEGATALWLRAQAAGYWAAVGAFASIGWGPEAIGMGYDRYVPMIGFLAAAVPFVLVLIAEARRARG
ncbi:hypothetical protein BCF33_2272 [Hasllibacter halocynthiae]|uniref:Uncharacterized protein n=1 Tax=Hasllibacter halocynthiae TaxID=595589 RepID=A0A2T0X3G8_9RHOB|nr:hypothetical protein [Hasllibacter halocynthiae]PRY93404.1 hypothetical protein BCF33_2272 [Hasllibacter halocynthiae]